MTHQKPVIAVLYQALAPPMYDGVSKPPKPGGYRDSGADVAYALSRGGFKVLTPVNTPDPADQNHWCYPDTEEGILTAVQQGATHIWANTVLFAEHPLQTSILLNPYASSLKVIGQPPICADRFDDKAFTNDELRRHGGFTLPRSWSVNDPRSSKGDDVSLQKSLDDVIAPIKESDYPIVAKPVRGRGSHGVKICNNAAELREHTAYLFNEAPQVLIEQYLKGEEGTITIMPPSDPMSGLDQNNQQDRHWALPPVIRFNHVKGIAPYSGNVAVTVNSRAVTGEEIERDPAYSTIMRECEAVAELLQTTAPLRIDIRRFGPDTNFALFDINMKPNITGPGRPGREDQTSLMGLAAESLGWDYLKFLEYVLGSSQGLGKLREYQNSLNI
ncbi:D-alanine--D-alanine ligase [Penicillium hetheringtonii]|uniref:D-alanine--D-alanine ligase n=1 Tax=Penicillium hetheringtonii TaxID=911720 RepID=A0AAD6DX98_9EURO|nr:D-alanine--D-alanine ligase [Penicillium hetheringtonii]